MGKISFTVSARTARLIGKENFSNAGGAIIELIKNTYDADSKIGIVIVDPIDDQIFIIDEGKGMSEKEIKDRWMVLGTDDKLDSPLSNTSRIKTGSKGIGRFAIDRLGSKCTMFTKPLNNSNILRWSVDWEAFSKKSAVLSDIKASLDYIEESDIRNLAKDALADYAFDNDLFNIWNQNKGTIIHITSLRDQWNDKSVNGLYSNLELLIPPQITSKFNLYLYSSLKPKDYGKVESTICDDFDYKLAAHCNERGELKIEVHRNELDIEILKQIDFYSSEIVQTSPNIYGYEVFQKGFFIIKKTLKELLAGFKDIDDNLKEIGAFEFEFYFMKRGGGQEKDEIKKYPYKIVNFRDRAKWLNEFGGIKLFRDNFRVRPYGETNSNSFDWLDLGKRALQNPTVTRPGYKVRPQQSYGIVKISRLHNEQFEDKSGREGIQENDTFSLFKIILLELIGIFEKDRNQIMMALKKNHGQRNGNEKVKKEAKMKAKEKQGNPELKTSDKDTKTLVEGVLAFEEEIEELKDEQKMLRVLASAGMIVTSFAHDFKNISDNILPRTSDLKLILKNLIPENQIIELPEDINPMILIDDIQDQDKKLKHWLDFSLGAIKKNKRTRRNIDLVVYLKKLQRLWNSILEKKKIVFSIKCENQKGLFFKAHEIDLDSIFINLITNSVDAFNRADAPNERKIEFRIKYDSKNGINVVYEDTGPGLVNEIMDPNVIFQPFYSTKRDEHTGEQTGIGLGLWILKSVVDEYNGLIRLTKLRPGFKLCINLPT